MGSVLDYIECPNCKQEAYSDFYYKTGEEYVNCQNCGYHYSATFKKDNEGKFVTRDGSENYILDNLVLEEKEIKNPYGAYRYKMAGDVATTCGSLATEEDANEFRVEMRLAYKGYVDFAQISRFVDNEIKVEYVVDQEPDQPNPSSIEAKDNGEIF